MKAVLNSQQLQAIEADGPLLITAGPGTGKTKTLTARIVRLLKNGVPPREILALTFTNKAAHEMQQRVAVQLANDDNTPLITTFHAFCWKLLKENGETPRIISELEHQRLIVRLKKSRVLQGISITELSLKISLAKAQVDASHDHALTTLVNDYQSQLAARNLIDFDDVLLRAHKLLKDTDTNRPFTHILVDEFQDTNAVQYDILNLLDVTGAACVIGDPGQSIYGFRGATADMFAKFRRDRPACTSVSLVTNYRSVPALVRVGNAVFPDRTPLQAHRQTEGIVRCMQTLNEYAESDWIIRTIEEDIGGSTMITGHEHSDKQGNRGFRDFAVLYRSHHIARTLRHKLEMSGLPFQIVGEDSPYRRQDISAVIACLEWLIHGRDLPETVFSLSAIQLRSLLAPIQSRTSSEHVGELVVRIMTILGLDASDSQLLQFQNAAARFQNQEPNAFLEYIRQIAEQEYYDPAADAITLLTIHAAKGLEFDHVFLIGAEDGLLPLKRARQDSSLDEERRLFYVAVTRARSQLDILYTKKRQGTPSTPSPFVKDMPQDILPRHIDPDMTSQQERLRKRAIKRSQTSLF